MGIDAVVNDVGIRAFEDDVGLGHEIRGSNEDGDGEDDIEEERNNEGVCCETKNEGVEDPDDEEEYEETYLNSMASLSFASHMCMFFWHCIHFNN